MRFFYENNCGDTGYFSEKDLIKAIYTAWNIEADLYLLNDGLNKIDKNIKFRDQVKIVLAPYEDNDFNSEILKPFGYYMIDGNLEREIRQLDDDKWVRYKWSEVKSLV